MKLTGLNLIAGETIGSNATCDVRDCAVTDRAVTDVTECNFRSCQNRAGEIWLPTGALHTNAVCATV